MAELFLGKLASGDFPGLGELFEPDVEMRALLPDGPREWQGPEPIVAAFARWFGRSETYELLDASVGHLGPRLQLRWRARVRGGSFPDADFVVQQHVYADAGPSGRIQSLAMLCSGFVREQSDG